MKKQDMERAARDRWAVKDDFGATGEVLSIDGAEHVLVQWADEDTPARVHYTKAERA